MKDHYHENTHHQKPEYEKEYDATHKPMGGSAPIADPDGRNDPVFAILQGYAMKSFTQRAAIGITALLAIPLLGIWFSGLPLNRYLTFPPEGRYVEHAPFAWPVFIALLLIECLAIAYAIRAGLHGNGKRSVSTRSPFPWWGWAALAWTGLWWVCAWSRFDALSFIQLHTFTPLWLGFIVIINAITFRTCGRCMMTHQSGYFLKLFPVSAAFWWFFEYLNRFVQNWTYEHVESLSPLGYFIFASASFSTVLPAVMSTDECLKALGVAHRADDRPVPPPSTTARLGLFITSVVGLFFLGVAPNSLFPLLWLAPLGLLVFVQPLDYFPRAFPTIGTLLRLSLAALICGFFWEMWNHYSFAKWVYHVPYVGRFQLFEMPVLGFFGYLPFGWECAWLAGMVKR